MKGQTSRWNGEPTGTGAAIGSITHQRMVSMRLHQNELALFDQIMGTPGNLWPEGLAASLNAKCGRYGLCGEVVASHVADWIRSAFIPTERSGHEQGD